MNSRSSPTARDHHSRDRRRHPPRHQRLPRSSGILMHLSSLPGPHGIGDVGPAAHALVDLLADARQHWWQILPLGPVGEGFSPYSSFSSMAGNPLLISPELLVADGLLRRRDIAPPRFDPRRVDYPRVEQHKLAVLDAGWQRFVDQPPKGMAAAFSRFRRANREWVEDYALYMALRQRYDQTPWVAWPRPLVQREPAALAAARAELESEISRHAFYQFLFYRQWGQLRRHAAERGLKIIGDLPIFVAAESVDVWANPRLFLLDRSHRPKTVAGVPPDYFSKTGQRWGNPMYDWPAMQQEKFAWWVRRFRGLLQQVDLVRIDHFRGFAACWHVPSSAPDARTGKWICSPGNALLAELSRQLRGLPFIAEDLGVITPDVESLRDDWHLPGMKVLQFAFGGDAKNPFLPHNYVHNAIAYTGTHDNDTTASWFKQLNATERKNVLRYAPAARHDPVGTLIQLVWQSVADVAIAPLQDVLRVGSEGRMNTPGTTDGNWQWRLTDLKAAEKGLRPIAEMTETYGRAVEEIRNPKPEIRKKKR